MTTSLFQRGALAIGGAALLLSATIGFSQAQTVTPPAGSLSQQQRQAIVNLAASKLGVTGDQLSGALKDARKDLGLQKGQLHIGKLVRQELTVAATTLGIADVKALRKELAGSTLTAVAQKHNVQPATLSAAMKADIDAQIQALVTNGNLPPNRAAPLKLKAEARVDAFMIHQFKAPRVSQ